MFPRRNPQVSTIAKPRFRDRNPQFQNPSGEQSILIRLYVCMYECSSICSLGPPAGPRQAGSPATVAQFPGSQDKRKNSQKQTNAFMAHLTGLAWTPLDPFGLTCIHVDSLGFTWNHLDLLSSLLNSFGPARSNKGKHQLAQGKKDPRGQKGKNKGHVTHEFKPGSG